MTTTATTSRAYSTQYLTDCGERFLREAVCCCVVLRNPRPEGRNRRGELPDLLGFRVDGNWINSHEIEVKGDGDSCDGEKTKAHNQPGACATGDYRYLMASPNIAVYAPNGTATLVPDDKGNAHLFGDEPWQNPRVDRRREMLLLIAAMAQVQQAERYGVQPKDAKTKRFSSAKFPESKLDELALLLAESYTRKLGRAAKDLGVKPDALRAAVTADERFVYDAGSVMLA